MTRPRTLLARTLLARTKLVRTVAALSALSAAGISTGAQAACALVDSVIGLGRVATVAQLTAMQGKVVSGTLVRGTAAPVDMRLSGCSTTLATTVSGSNVVMTTGGVSVTFAPWLISVDGVTLATPKDLTLATHSFTGNPTLGILMVPVATPASLAAGQFSASALLTFTDPS